MADDSSISTRAYVDSHCHMHLYSDKYMEMFEKAESCYCKEFLNIFDITDYINNINDLHLIIERMRRKGNIYVGIGVHPNSCNLIGQETAQEMMEILLNHHDNIMAVGETGIDLYRGDNLSRQIEFLKLQIKLCIKRKKVLTIHWRNCDVQTILDVIDETAGDNILPFIFHCFYGNEIEAEKIVKRGGMISLSGIVTFQQKQDSKFSSLLNSSFETVVKKIPNSHLLMETDSPFLTPEPLRGKEKNESKNIGLIYEKVAQIRNVTVEKLCETVLENWMSLKYAVGIYGTN